MLSIILFFVVSAPHPYVLQLAYVLLKIVCLLVAIAYFTIAERKIMAAIQRRRGPNVVGFWGLLQPLADGLKLIVKEMVIPSHANNRIFVLAPVILLTLSLSIWCIIPFGYQTAFENRPADNGLLLELLFSSAKNSGFFLELNSIANVNYGLLLILAVSSLNVYAIIIAGWASNSKYAFLGALRSAAQMISYEVTISLTILPIVVLSGSLNLSEIVSAQRTTVWYIFPLLPAAIVFFISMIAETNRTPFDLPEAEAELVAGYNVEYSSIIFAMFFLAEYANMILMSLLTVILFFGGWSGETPLINAATFTLKGLVFCFFFVLVRATLPRYRYDQLMDIGWKVFLPITTGFLFHVIGIITAFGLLPVTYEIA